MYIRWRVAESYVTTGRRLSAELMEGVRDPHTGNPRPRCRCYLGSIQKKFSQLLEEQERSWSIYAEIRGRFWLQVLARLQEQGFDLDASPPIVEMIERRVPLATMIEANEYLWRQHRIWEVTNGKRHHALDSVMRDRRGCDLLQSFLERRVASSVGGTLEIPPTQETDQQETTV
jgi:hypothetical protein